MKAKEHLKEESTVPSSLSSYLQLWRHGNNLTVHWQKGNLDGARQRRKNTACSLFLHFPVSLSSPCSPLHPSAKLRELEQNGVCKALESKEMEKCCSKSSNQTTVKCNCLHVFENPYNSSFCTGEQQHLSWTCR